MLSVGPESIMEIPAKRLAWVEEATGESAWPNASSIRRRHSPSALRASIDRCPLRHGGSRSNRVENYNIPAVRSDNQAAADSTEAVVVDGGGNFIGLAPRAVAEVNSTIASPEQNSFFMMISRHFSGPRPRRTLDPFIGFAVRVLIASNTCEDRTTGV